MATQPNEIYTFLDQFKKMVETSFETMTERITELQDSVKKIEQHVSDLEQRIDNIEHKSEPKKGDKKQLSEIKAVQEDLQSLKKYFLERQVFTIPVSVAMSFYTTIQVMVEGTETRHVETIYQTLIDTFGPRLTKEYLYVLKSSLKSANRPTLFAAITDIMKIYQTRNKKSSTKKEEEEENWESENAETTEETELNE